MKRLRREANEIGTQLGATGTCEIIRQFVQQARSFAQPRKISRTFWMSQERAASYWKSNRELAVFTHLVLASGIEGLEFDFAASILNARLRMLREPHEAEDLNAELENAIQATTISEVKSKLLWGLYSRPHPLLTGILYVLPILILQSDRWRQLPVLSPWTQCQILAGMYHADWHNVKLVADAIYENAAEEERLNCFAALLFEASSGPFPKRISNAGHPESSF